MKMFNKYVFVALAAVLGFTACSDDDEYKVGEVSDGAFVYADFTSKTYLPDAEQTLTFNVGRTNANGEQTFAIGCDNEMFSMPQSVTFKDGEKKAEVPVTFNLSIGESCDVKFYVDSDEATFYGDDTLSLTIKRDYTWRKVGTAKFTDGIYGIGASVEVDAAKELAGYYKFVAPMYAAFKSAGKEELPGEADLKFMLSEDGTIGFSDGIYDLESGTSLIGYQMYYANGRYPSYCYITNQNGTITFSFLLYDGSGLYGPVTWGFEWTDGYPYASTNVEEE